MKDYPCVHLDVPNPIGNPVFIFWLFEFMECLVIGGWSFFVNQKS